MKPHKPIRISVPAALQLIDLISEQARQSENDSVKKILLRAGIKIADIALEGETPSRRVKRAA